MSSLFLFAESAAVAFVELASEALFHQIVETVTERFEIHVIDNFVDEGILQQQFGFFERDASLTHVEEGGIIELTHGRAMRALHVVGINFQHWLGEHTGLLGGSQVLISHLRGSLLSTMFYQYTSSKSAYGLVVKDIFIELVRSAMRGLMDDKRIVIDMLLLIGNHTTVAAAFSSLARESEVEFVASDTVVQRDDVMVHTTVALLVDIDIADANVLSVRLFEAIEVERGILTHIGLDDLRSEEITVVGRMVAEEHLELCALIQDNQHTTIHHQVDIASQDIDDLDGTIDLNVLGNIDIEAILSQHRVQVGGGVTSLTR